MRAYASRVSALPPLGRIHCPRRCGKRVRESFQFLLHILSHIRHLKGGNLWIREAGSSHPPIRSVLRLRWWVVVVTCVLLGRLDPQSYLCITGAPPPLHILGWIMRGPRTMRRLAFCNLPKTNGSLTILTRTDFAL